MSSKNYLINTLIASEKTEFDKIVKTYLREIFGFKRIVLTDGNNDTGIDVKVFDIDEKRIQFQLTTQKSASPQEKRAFESKLFDDVKKAEINSTVYGYSNTLLFFYSCPLTNKVIQSYQNKALLEHSINLSIIDANRIADESEEYLQLLNSIVETNNINEILNTNKVFPSEEKNLIFDLLSFGKTSDFKLQIVEAFILKQFHVHGKLNTDEIIETCHNKFGAKENNIFYEKLIARLQSEKRILKTEQKKVFTLSHEEAKRISGLIGQSEVEQNDLLYKIVEVLKQFSQEQNAEDYIIELKKIYVSNFNNDLTELLSMPTKDLSSLSREFLVFIRSKNVKEENISELAFKLVEICKDNHFLQKFCAAKVFSETTKISNIQKYIYTQKKVFVDTQIILYALCYFYNPKTTFKNYFFNTTKSLLNFTKKNNIDLFLPVNYLWEAQSHLREAFNLIPFTHLPNFERLGKSRNVFYNFFLFERESLQDNELTYNTFFENFGFNFMQSYKVHNSIIEEYINKLGIKVADIKEPYYEIENTRRMLVSIMSENGKFKSRFGLNNDSIIMEYLSDKNVDIHPLQPMLLSWDKVLFKARTEYFKRNATAGRWFLLTPGRFIDQYSLLKFSIDSEMVTGEILAFLSNDLIQGTHSLIDSITHILNPNEEVGLMYTNLLTDIRDNEILNLKENKISLPDDVEGEAVIDDVMYNLTSYYRESKEKFEDFKNIFLNPALLENVKDILIKVIDIFYQQNKFNDQIFVEFDHLIEQSKLN